MVVEGFFKDFSGVIDPNAAQKREDVNKTALAGGETP